MGINARKVGVFATIATIALLAGILGALVASRSHEPATDPYVTELARLVTSIEGEPEPAQLASLLTRIKGPRPTGPTWAERLDAAERFVDRRAGAIAFAMTAAGADRSGGVDRHVLFPPASVVKSMLLAAELQRLDAAGLPLDPTTEQLLTNMITVSDNDAATAIYTRVGDAGLLDIAERVGMSDIQVGGSWGYTQISADDMALLFSQLDRALPERYARFGRGLLGSITPEQSWGVPTVAGRWKVRFKGGWLPTDSGQLVSQAAELRRDGRKLGIAILTDGQPSMEYGIETVEGVAARLLGR